MRRWERPAASGEETKLLRWMLSNRRKTWFPSEMKRGRTTTASASSFKVKVKQQVAIEPLITGGCTRTVLHAEQDMVHASQIMTYEVGYNPMQYNAPKNVKMNILININLFINSNNNDIRICTQEQPISMSSMLLSLGPCNLFSPLVLLHFQ